MDRNVVEPTDRQLLEVSMQYRVVNIMSRFLWITCLFTLVVVLFFYPISRLRTEGVGLALLTVWLLFGHFCVLKGIQQHGRLDWFVVGMVVPAVAMVCVTLFQSPDDFGRAPVVLIAAFAGLAFHRHRAYWGVCLPLLALFVVCRYLSSKPLTVVDFPLLVVYLPVLAIILRILVGEFNRLSFSQTRKLTSSLAESIATKHELQSKHIQLETILERAPLILCVLDKNGTYVQSRGSGLSDLGFGQDELVGRSYYDVFKDFPRAVEVVKSSLIGKPARTRMTFGSDLILEVCYEALRDGNGEIIGSVGVAVNVTPGVVAEQKNLELEKQLAHSQKLESLGVLAGGVAHDFNNYLMAIVAFSESLTEDDGLAVKETAKQIQLVAQQAASVCDQMLVYAGKHESETRENVVISELLTGMERFMRAIVPKSVAVTMELEMRQELFVSLNPFQIQQVVINALRNACDAVVNESNPEIHVGIERYRSIEANETQRFGAYSDDSKYVQIIIRDNGCGIVAADLEKIFDLYFTTKTTGHGFGMAVAARIMADHNAFIEFDEASKTGTTIRLVLPLVSKPVVDTREVESVNETGDGLRASVLVVDDEPSVLSAVSMLLDFNGHQVAVADSAVQAMQVMNVQGSEIDLLILDFSMPNCNGLELLQKLREEGFTQPAVLCSGHILKAQECPGVGHWPEAVLSKPYSYHDLNEIISELCPSRLLVHGSGTSKSESQF